MLPRVFLLFLLLFTVSYLNLFSKDLRVTVSNENTFGLSYEPGVIDFQPIIINNEISSEKAESFVLPKFENAYNVEKRIGNYSLIVRKELITVPGADKYSIKKVDISEFKSFDVKMAPVPKRSVDGLDYELASDLGQDLPELFSHKYVGVSGDRHLVELSFVVAYFDMSMGRTMVASKFEVEIDFENDGVNGNFGYRNRIGTDPNISLNHNETKDFRRYGQGLSPRKREKNVNSFLDGNLNEQTWVRLEISKEGVYKVDNSMLSALNVSISKDDISSIRVFGIDGEGLSELVNPEQFNEMNEQEIIVNANGDGSLKEIIFYGSSVRGFKNDDGDLIRYINPYSKTANYLLTWGGIDGKRASSSEFSGTIENTPKTYSHKYFFEEEVYSPFPFGAGRQYIGNIVNNVTYSTDLHNLYPGGVVRYFFSLAHQSIFTSYFNIRENGNLIKDGINIAQISTYTPTRRKFQDISINSSQIASDGKSRINIEYVNEKSVSSYGYLDYFEIHYDRYFRAIGDEISFFSDSELEGNTEFNISGFGGSNKYLFDVSEANKPKLLENYSTSGDGVAIRTELSFGVTKKFFASSKLRVPSLFSLKFNDLRSEDIRGDIILITHKSLLNSAEKYKEYRESKGEFGVQIVTTDDIYNNFSCGTQDPVAIRDFIAYAVNNWEVQPRYVLLWGDGHSDYKGINYSAINYVPPYEFDDNDTSYDEDSNFASDDFYTYVLNDDKRMDIAIGRVTVDSPSSSELFLEKLKFYEDSSSADSWRTKITLVADDAWVKTDNGNPTRDGSSHVVASEYLANNIINKDMALTKIYLPEYKTVITSEGRRKPDLNQDLASNVKSEGALLLNWLGHGNPSVWAHESVFSKETSVKEYTNYDKLFFLTAATCDFSRFDQSTGRTGADELLLSERGGAIGVFAATRIVYASQNEEINDRFYTNLFTRDFENKYLTVGEALKNVKQQLFEENDQKYFILGDPSMRINIPDYQIVMDRFNGVVIDSSSNFEVKGLSEITFEGHIETNGNELASGFSGDIRLVFHDGDVEVETESDGIDFYFRENGGILNISNAKVENGKFTVTFQLPRDISYSENNGKLFAYAKNDNGLYAKGSFHSLDVYGIDENAQKDDEKPEVEIYLDSYNFKKGDVVSSSPLLLVNVKDNMGVNSSGSGIGHRIEAFIDNGEYEVDLTNSYSVDENDNKIGLMQKQLNELSVGRHSVKVRAWDLQNNYIVDSTYFYVKENYFVKVFNVTPNPFVESTEISFEHNITPPFDIEIEIVDFQGRSVNQVKGLVNTPGVGTVVWNGTDKNNMGISQGTYVFMMKVRDFEGNESHHEGTLLVKVK